jgi:hypothetical protein
MGQLRLLGKYVIRQPVLGRPREEHAPQPAHRFHPLDSPIDALVHSPWWIFNAGERPCRGNLRSLPQRSAMIWSSLMGIMETQSKIVRAGALKR